MMMLMMAWNHGDGNGRHSSLAAPASACFFAQERFSASPLSVIRLGHPACPVNQLGGDGGVRVEGFI